MLKKTKRIGGTLAVAALLLIATNTPVHAGVGWWAAGLEHQASLFSRLPLIYVLSGPVPVLFLY